MIRVRIKTNNDHYNSIIETLYTERVRMDKVADGEFYSDDDVLYESYKAWDELMKRKWFTDSVIYYLENIDGEETDLVQEYYEEIRLGLVK